MKRQILAVFVAILLLGTIEVEVKATENQMKEEQNLQVGQLVETEDNQIGQIISVDNEGAYYVEIIDASKIFKIGWASCQHTNLTYKKTEVNNQVIGTKEECYKTRNKITYICNSCSATVVKYGSWSIITTHNFSAILHVCKKCGYKK